ncbi:MAG: uroporphyrinogen-III C-methyltransferase [Betaproteobacteria bacterium]|nr:uroporphyrinogen-III C-methyltransferase [Betaproteobacteria bacterium]
MSGKAWLIGAGPGDVELLTLKAVRALGEADVVLIDDLVNREVLRYAKASARVIAVGKRGGCRSTPQAFIERLMLRLAGQGKTVARAKGGDPFVFGRGGEEFAALIAAGIAVEVVSGITAGVAVPALLNIPVTHREHCRGVTFITGATRDGAKPNWHALVASGATLVIYMGLKNLPAIVAGLRGAGMAASMPVAVVQNGTLPSQRQVVATLAQIANAVAQASLQSPALIVVGEVVHYAKTGAVEALARKQA